MINVNEHSKRLYMYHCLVVHLVLNGSQYVPDFASYMYSVAKMYHPAYKFKAVKRVTI